MATCAVAARVFAHAVSTTTGTTTITGWIDLIDSRLPAAKGADPDFTLDAIGNRSSQRFGESVAVAYRYGKTNFGHPSVPRNHHQNGLCGRLGSLLVLANHRCANAGSPQGISVKRNPASVAAKVWVFGLVS